MISTATTKLDPRPQDGGLRDLDPRRRTARLRDGNVRIERLRPLRHVVHLPDGSRRHRRTFGAAERTGHSYLDRTLRNHRPDDETPAADHTEPTSPSGLRSFLLG